jgi:IclR family pca regulon transcriptional regulator
MSDVVRSAARVLDLLEFFSDSEKKANLAAVAQNFAMPKSSALGLLKTLCVRGYLDKDEKGLYQLNDTFRRYGFNSRGAKLTRVLAVAKPIMAKMASELEETITLGMLTEEGKIRLVHQSLCSQAIRYEMPESLLLPVHCTAMGRMILAMMSIAARSALLSRYPLSPWTRFTVTDPAELNQLINDAGRRNYAISADEVDVGGTGVCSPVKDSEGQPVAMLNVSCVSARYADKKNFIIKSVLEQAKLLTDMLA